ncbi:hypothetical protein Tco_0909468 [Tanacetum coccineum]|uniref:Uncharacterized protein n=1 Tax=Tanacetum coccineum TaxID=301880 RepID=A0ABQ5CS87_9ASTR
MQKNVLKHQFENFSTASNESLDKAYDRFQKLISQLEVHGASISKEDINQKFLRSLPPSWNQISLIMRNKPYIDEIDIDDLYNNLRVYKDEIKRSSSSTFTSQNLSFLSFENTSSTNEVSTASGDFRVSTAGGISQVSTTPCAHDVACSFFAQPTTSPQLENEDFQQIDEDDLEELDLRWQVAMLTVQGGWGRYSLEDGRKELGFQRKMTYLEGIKGEDLMVTMAGAMHQQMNLHHRHWRSLSTRCEGYIGGYILKSCIKDLVALHFVYLLWAGNLYSVMSDSEHSIVTYTSVSFPVEDDSDIGEILRLGDTTTAAASRTTDSPGYVPESDPEEEPEEDDEDPEEDPADYPADRDDDDEDEDEDKDKEEEEHPAPAGSVPPVHRVTARISIRDEPSISLPPMEEVERLLALTTLPPSPLTPLSSPLPQIPSSPLPISSPPPNSPYLILIFPRVFPRFEEDGPAVAREDPYSGITDTWDDSGEETTIMYGIMEDAQDDRSQLRGRVNFVRSQETVVIKELWASDHKRQVQLTKALELLKGLQTHMAEFQRQLGPAKGLAQPDAPGEAGSSS